MKTTAQKTWAAVGRALILAATVKVVFALNARVQGSGFATGDAHAPPHLVMNR